MNQIDEKLPEIDTRACHYAVIEYEINQILKEFDIKTEANETEEKTLDHIYDKLNIIHNQVKLLKAKRPKCISEVYEPDVVSPPESPTHMAEKINYLYGNGESSRAVSEELWRISLNQYAPKLDLSSLTSERKEERKSDNFK